MINKNIEKIKRKISQLKRKHNIVGGIVGLKSNKDRLIIPFGSSNIDKKLKMRLYFV